MFANLNQAQADESTDPCSCFTCFVHGQRLVCHSRWRPQTVDVASESASGWGA